MKNEGLISKYKVLQILYESYGLRDAEKRIAELPIVSYSEKPNKCEDAISRQAAIDIVSGYEEQLESYIGLPDDSEVYAYARGLLLSIERNLNALQPSVSMEKTGHWIEDENEMLVRCSKCGEEHEECSKYCPNCGAKMEVEE